MSGIFDAYVKGDARAFFGPDPTQPGDRRSMVDRVARPVSAAVASVIATQNTHYASSGARDANLEALRQGAAAVVTGQQAGLFLGPLYTLYKAATAIRVASALAEESGRAVVPVFWLQTEDHDLEEIATCRIARPDGSALDIALPLPDHARISIAHRELPDEILTCLATLNDALDGSPHGAEHIALLERHYRPGAGWSQAFAGVLAELFTERGLIVVDPRDPELAAAAAPVHAHALTRASAISDALENRSRALASAGFETTVFVRPGAPLSFFHPDGASGSRTRLDPVDAGYVEAGGSRTFSEASLLAALNEAPLAFSTSALLRPIVQDTLLPTAAYVGGPGEVAYFAQLAPLYAEFEVAMPMIVPRARFRVVDGALRDDLSRLGLVADDLASPEDVVLARCRSKADGARATVDLEQALLSPFEAALDKLAPELEAAGEGIATAIGKTKSTVRMAVSKLAAKYEKALLHEDSGMVGEVRRLKGLLYPDGAPQERVYGLPSFAATFGQREFVDMVLAAVVPFDATPRDLP